MISRSRYLSVYLNLDIYLHIYLMFQVEDVKAAFGKKLKVLEQQLEQEHEDR